MKNLFLLITLIAASNLMAATLVPVTSVFSPKGFDSNDDTEVIVAGYLPNLCYKSPKAEYEVDGNKINITIKARKNSNNNLMCPEAIVPFVESIHVGVMDKGHYEITVNGNSIYEKKSEIYVAEATSDAIDEDIYANVEYVEKQLGSRTVQLKGYNPSDCFVLDEINVVDNDKNVYSVLPKMKQVSDFCPMKMVPFTIEMEVPSKLKAEEVLLHVRVMDGKSVNSVFNNTIAK